MSHARFGPDDRVGGHFGGQQRARLLPPACESGLERSGNRADRHVSMIAKQKRKSTDPEWTERTRASLGFDLHAERREPFLELYQG